jgi:hypothetical protein
LERNEVHLGFWWGSLEERELFGRLGVHKGIMLKQILMKQDGKVWTALKWLTI